LFTAKTRCLFVAPVLASWIASSLAATLDLEALPLADALERLRSQGLVILYSSDLVRPEMRVLSSPTSADPRNILDEILSVHGLATMDAPNGSIMIVRGKPSASAAGASRSLENDEALSNVFVEASRYALLRSAPPFAAQVSASELEIMPSLGEDPLHALASLPGIASNDFSARMHMRGGAVDETLVRLDGLRLYNPFHLKDFQAVFSAIDSVFVDRIDVYTGSYPAHLGERMSGVIDIHSIDVPDHPRREISLSLFNSAALASGHLNEGASDWLISARRGNLDLLLDWSKQDVGVPSYTDLYGRFGHHLSDELTLRANFLMLDDNIRLNDSDHEELARADYRDRYVWASIDYVPSQELEGRLILARTDLDSHRRGSADQSGIGSGTLDDSRAHSIDTTLLEVAWALSPAATLRFGAEWRQVSGRYDYSDEAEFDLLVAGSDVEPDEGRSHALQVRRNGDQYGIYSSARLLLTERFTADLGLRWDRSTLSDRYDGEISPRLAVLYELGEKTLLRGSWGRFAQLQGIDELQVSDGIQEFSDAQQADHWVASLEHAFTRALSLRIEGFRKDYRDLRPRFENLLNTIALLPELKPDRVQIAPQSAVIEGAEISLRRKSDLPLFWWLSYTWSRAYDLIDGAKAMRSWDQTHALNAGFGWDTERWQVSAATSYRTGWPRANLVLVTTEPTPTSIAVRNSGRLRAYADLDLRIARKFRFDETNLLTVFLEVSNVLNRNNQCCIEYEYEDEEEEEGEPFLELESVNSLPLLPSLGFSWRF
jgi:outer membrane cobalamin receptor